MSAGAPSEGRDAIPRRDLSAPLTRAVLALWSREGKWAEISLAGVSMSPLIPHGSVLTVHFGRFGLARGDVVLYGAESRIIAHRVLRLGRRGRRWGFVKVKGDPVRPGEASWIPVEDVVGRVVAVRRPDGSAVILNTASGRFRGRMAAAVSGTASWVESKARSRLGLRRDLTITPALLRLLGPLGRSGAERALLPRREAGLLLRKEERFLIAAARLTMGSADRKRLGTLLRSETPWERILSSASSLGLAPLLYRNLSRIEFQGHVPPEVLSSLARSAHAAAIRMAIQLDALQRIVAALREAGLEPVLLKGAALATMLYDQPALRSMQDIDLLVAEGQVAPAVAVLEREGFRAIATERGAAFYAAHHHATPMIGAGGRVIVEIHRGLLPPESGLHLDPVPFLERAVRTPEPHGGYLVLSREDQVLHACLHLSCCDRFVGKLRDLLDVHSLVEAEAPRLDWGRLLEASGGIEAARGLYSTLDLARRLLGTAVPAEALHEMARAAGWDPVAERLLRTLARASLFSGSPSDGILPGASARWVCGTLLRRPHWGARLRALVQMLGEA